jgi:ABC-type sugar transport system permease subunit
MPMAISFVGAAVIWKLIYDARPEDVARSASERDLPAFWAATAASRG